MLQHHDEGGDERCSACGAVAVGPCARCGASVCGDCCVLTEGGATMWAICLRCDERAGRSLGRGWLVVLSWIAAPIALLFAAIVVLALLAGRC
jgi:hypothetical protein